VGRPSAHESGDVTGMLHVFVVEEPRDVLGGQLCVRAKGRYVLASGTEATSSMDNSSISGALWLKGPSITST
jgi:hypothetical protein